MRRMAAISAFHAPSSLGDADERSSIFHPPIVSAFCVRLRLMHWGRQGSPPESGTILQQGFPSIPALIAKFVTSVEAGAIPERCSYGARIGMVDCVGVMIAGAGGASQRELAEAAER